MSSFTRFNASLKIEYLGFAPRPDSVGVVLEREYWRVLESFSFYLKDDQKEFVIIPMHFVTDGASIPRLFWPLLPRWGQYGQAAVLHDYLIDHGIITEFHEADSSVTTRMASRSEARRIFNSAMKVLDVPKEKRRLIIAGVWAWDVLCLPVYKFVKKFVDKQQQPTPQ